MCVPLGTCSTGYALLYADADGDGVGAGPQLTTCQALPAAPGFSAVDTDCAPQDENLWRLETLYPDNDADGYSGNPNPDQCIGDVPAGTTLVPVPPPRISLESVNAEQISLPGGDNWDDFYALRSLDGSDADVGLEAATPADPDCSDYLFMRNFEVFLPQTANPVGVRVHIIKRATFAGGTGVFDGSVRLVVGGTPVGDDRASPDGWPVAFDDVVYGGPADLWGAGLTRADIMNGQFGVAISACNQSSDSGQAEVDWIWIEVFTDETDNFDCNDNDENKWSTRGFFTDADGDRYTVGSQSFLCVGGSVPTGLRDHSYGADCMDNNSSVRPNQSDWFTTDRGDGSFDYDCSTDEELEPLHSSTACLCDVADGACLEDTFVDEPAGTECGAPGETFTCEGTCPDMCALTPQPAVVRCH